MAAPPAVTGWDQRGTRREVYSPTPSRANPSPRPRATRPVSPIQLLSKASFRKKPIPSTKATAPMMANQFRPRTCSQSMETPGGNRSPNIEPPDAVGGTSPAPGAAGATGEREGVEPEGVAANSGAGAAAW